MVATPLPGMRRCRIAAASRLASASTVVAALVLAVGGCVAPEPTEPEPGATLPRDDLAARATSVPADTTMAAPERTPRGQSPANGGGDDDGAGQGGGVGSGDRGGRPGGRQTEDPSGEGAVGWRTVLSLGDPVGDPEPGGAPGYADLAGLRIASSGSRARVTVTMAGPVSARLAGGEVVGVGVDFFRTGASESDYQVFLDGGAHGWRAFLQTPDGFVRFPGTLILAAERLVVELPWSALGGTPRGGVAVFADWSSGDTLRSTSYDRAPEQGTRSLRRR